MNKKFTKEHEKLLESFDDETIKIITDALKNRPHVSIMYKSVISNVNSRDSIYHLLNHGVKSEWVYGIYRVDVRNDVSNDLIMAREYVLNILDISISEIEKKKSENNVIEFIVCIICILTILVTIGRVCKIFE